MSETKRPTVEAAEELLGLYFPVLDHGCIGLCDYLGSDKCIDDAARVSYGAGTRKTNETKGLIRYLRNHRHCYDANTDVLTERGFIPWPEVNENDILGIWDENLNSLKYEKPKYLTKDFYEGPMYKVEHKKIDLLVTPEHSMFVDTKEWCPIRKNMFWSEKRKLIKANVLNNKSMIRYFKSAPYNMINLTNNQIKNINFIKENIESDDIISSLKLIGFFIGDGHASDVERNSNRVINFHLKKERKIKYLKQLCKNLNLEFTDNIQKNGSHSFNVFKDDFRNFFRNNFYDENKFKIVPDFLLNLSKNEACALIDGLLNSDGSKTRDTYTYASNSIKLINSLQHVALHAGYAVNITKSFNGMHKCRLQTNQDVVINQARVNTSWENYSGYVYCAKTSTGVLVVRKNGKIVLSGNTSPTEMVELKFHVSCPIFVMRQLVRHRTASLNEYSGRYSLMPMLFYTPSKENFNYQNIQNNQGRGELIDEFKYKAAIERWNEIRKQSVSFYEDLTSSDVARELARIDLPLSVYTQFYWKIDLHNLFHLLSLRVDPHAQYEVRVFANVLAGIVKRLAPLSYEAWIDYELAGTKLSRMELNIIKSLIQTGSTQQGDKYILPANHSEMAAEKDAIKYELTKREFAELYNKLQPKEMPDFELDLSTAKSAQYFQDKMNAAVPRIDKLKAAEK